MKRAMLFAAALLAASPVIAYSMAEPPIQVGGQAMYPTKTIVANVVHSADHSTLLAAVKVAGLVSTLSARDRIRLTRNASGLPGTGSSRCACCQICTKASCVAFAASDTWRVMRSAMA